jgi:hypothetical protein
MLCRGWVLGGTEILGCFTADRAVFCYYKLKSLFKLQLKLNNDQSYITLPGDARICSPMRLQNLVAVHCIHDPAVLYHMDKYLFALLMTECYAVWARESREIDYDPCSRSQSGYAAIVTRPREQVPSGLTITITTMPFWSTMTSTKKEILGHFQQDSNCLAEW